MKVLVTGAAGFIGHKMAQKFRADQHDVLGWDVVNPTGNPGIQIVDMFDLTEIIEGLKSFAPDIVIHCAGSADVNKSVKNPEADFRGNVVITHNLLFGLQKAGMTGVRLVFLSSAGVYGNPQTFPITEETPLNPLSPYAIHKEMCEDLCRFFAKHYGMPVRVARIFSAYGAGLRKQIFWDMYCKFRLTGRLEMFGTGNESRDYIHVEDVVQALQLLALADTDEIVFNVANGEEITIRNATEMFAAGIGADPNVISFSGTVREGDPLNWRADISKIQKLGYRKTKDLQQGLNDYCQWAMGQEQ